MQGNVLSEGCLVPRPMSAVEEMHTFIGFITCMHVPVCLLCSTLFLQMADVSPKTECILLASNNLRVTEN
jgi:hypothetical protein